MDAQLYEDYATLERDHWWFTARRVIFHRLLATLPATPDATILDIGPGAGVFTAELQRYGTPIGVEFEAENAAFVRERTGLEVVEASATDMPFDDAIASLVVAGDVLEHVPDDAAAAQDIARVLAPTGSLLLTVPAHPSLWSSHDVAAHHQRRYTEASLRAVLEGGGLTIDYLTPYNVALLPPIAAVRALQRVRGRRDEAHSDFSLPAAPVNRALHAAFAAEAGPIARRRRLPFGVSLLVLARRAS